MEDRSYILGTNDAELERLRLQHLVWRPRMLDAWRRAGLTQSQTVIDIGCGPGYAALELSEIVGTAGKVIAVERSARFLEHLSKSAQSLGLTNITSVEADIAETQFGDAIADMAWCRWVFSWLVNPQPAVEHIARAMKSGGIVILHEYLDYRTWNLLPHSKPFATFVDATIASVSRTGAQMNAASYLPSALENSGFDILAANPILDVVVPQNFVWHWPAAFLRAYQSNLIASGLLTSEQATAALNALKTATTTPGHRMVTPMLLEIVAKRR